MKDIKIEHSVVSVGAVSYTHLPIHLTTRINPQKWIYKIKKFVGDGGLIVRRVT